MLFLDHESDPSCSGIVLKLWLNGDFILEVFKSKSILTSKPKGLKKLSFSPKELRTVKI